MNTALEWIKNKYSIDGQSPIRLNHFGRKSTLIQMFRELGFTKGVEIGTDNGDYAKYLGAGIPGLKLYCIDPWKPYTEGDEVKTQKDMDDSYHWAFSRTRFFDCELLRSTSMEAIIRFEDNSLDFVFIDGNHEY